MSTHANMVKMTVSGTPGTGTITLNAASSGYRSFATAYGANATVDILITEGTSWEVARNCTYTHSGTTVTRGTLESSSTGSAVSFTSAAVVSVVATAYLGNRTEMALRAITPGGRLTLESGVPVSTTDQTAKTTIYYTPYVHNIINLWDGTEWVPVEFSETSEALGTLTASLPYDVFGFLSSGVLDLEKLAWTSDTARATAVTLQDGRYCKSGDKTRLLLGTFRTTSTTQTEDSALKRFVSNVYNQFQTTGYVGDSTSHDYASTAVRYWNNSSANTVQWVSSLGNLYFASVYSSSASNGLAGLWPLNTASGTPLVNAGIFSSSGGAAVGSAYGGVAGAGYNYVAVSEYSVSGSATFYAFTFTVQLVK